VLDWSKIKENGIKVGVASSSKNCQAILKSIGLEDFSSQG